MKEVVAKVLPDLRQAHRAWSVEMIPAPMARSAGRRAYMGAPRKAPGIGGRRTDHTAG